MKSVSLKEVCDVFGDGDWIESKDQSDGGIRLIQTGNVGVGVFKDRIEKARWISEDTFKRLRCTEIREGDVIVSRLPDPVGRSCLIPALEHKAITAVDCSILRFDPSKMNAKFFIYYSQSSQYANAIEPLISGSTRQRISREKLGTVQIPLPSLKEQQSVVEKLDSAFVELDLLEKNLELSDEKVEQLLQSLLSASFTDSVIKPELKGALADRGNATVSVALKDFCKMYQPATISTKEMISNGEYVVYGANGPIGRYDKYNHEEPQLLITCRGATCGAVNISEPFAWINGNAMVIQPDLDSATLEYMKYAFLGGIDVSSSITGSAQPQITRTTLEVIKVPLPSLEKQREIVRKLDSAFAEIELLRSQFIMKRDYALALRQSLLSSTFTGAEEVA
jgi:type I restriction enzyme S subunit